MARYIDADKLCEALKSMASVQYPDKQSTILGVVSSIENFPTADVVLKSEGKWKPYKDYFTHRQTGWICTNCSVVINDLSNGDTNYCPHCGAVMETESEAEND